MRLLTLARVSNLPTVWSNCLAAWCLSGAGPSWLLLALIAGTSLLYAGGCTLNDACDVWWDKQHRPERLIPSGRMSARAVWIAGSAELLAGTALLLLCGPVPWWPVVALPLCIFLYDVWHKQSPLSVVTMGACRWLLYPAAAAVAGAALTAGMKSGAVLWLYIIVLSMVARGETVPGPAAGRSRWLLALVPAALLWAGADGWRLAACGVFAAGMAVLLPWRSRNPGQWVSRLLAGIPLVDLALVMLSLWAQRKFKAT
jgi:uncharacterized membrane protein